MRTIDLRGPDGNAWALMGYVTNWGKQLGWPKEKRDAICEEMRSGDYHHLLSVFEQAFEGIGVKFIGDPRKGEVENDEDDYDDEEDEE